MKFSKYITESTHSFSDIQKIIEKECQPYLKDWRKANGVFEEAEYHLFSGRKKISPDGSVEMVRQDRKPKDSDKKFHEFFDTFFFKKFGVKARSQSLFCSSSGYVASVFGTSHFIFPIGKYKIIYNPNITDLWDEIKGYDIFNYEDMEPIPQFFGMWRSDCQIYSGSMTKQECFQSRYKEWKDRVSGDLEDFKKGYVSTSALEYLKKGNDVEAMVDCNSYVMLQDTPRNMEWVSKELLGRRKFVP